MTEKHIVRYVETFRTKIVTLGEKDIVQAEIGVLESLATMERAKQERIGNLIAYLTVIEESPEAPTPGLSSKLRSEIESELGVHSA